MQKAGLEVNVTKSFFARSQLEHLGCWITRTGIKPVHDKVKAVLKIAEPKIEKNFDLLLAWKITTETCGSDGPMF